MGPLPSPWPLVLSPGGDDDAHDRVPTPPPPCGRHTGGDRRPALLQLHPGHEVLAQWIAENIAEFARRAHGDEAGVEDEELLYVKEREATYT